MEPVEEQLNNESLGRKILRYVGYILFGLFIAGLIAWPVLIGIASKATK